MAERQFNVSPSIGDDNPKVEMQSITTLIENHQLDAHDVIDLMDMEIGDVGVFGVKVSFDVHRVE